MIPNGLSKEQEEAYLCKYHITFTKPYHFTLIIISS